MPARPRLLAVAAVFAAAVALSTAFAEPAADGPQVLVDAELRFAADAAHLGTRAAFLRHLAPTSVVFDPGPVNGPIRWQKHAANAARLAWTPEYAEMSGSADLGWTTGPWSFRADSIAKEPVAWGHYFTVWKKLPGEGWKAVIDAGIDHAAVPLGGSPVLRALPASASRSKSPLAARRGLWEADESFGRIARKDGVAAAIRELGAGDVRVMRDGHTPMSGPGADTLATGEGVALLASNAQFISDAGDLGYTYGTLVTAPTDTHRSGDTCASADQHQSSSAAATRSSVLIA